MGGSGSKTETRSKSTLKIPTNSRNGSATTGPPARQAKSVPINTSEKSQGKTVPRKVIESSQRIRNGSGPMSAISHHFKKRQIESAPQIRKNRGNASDISKQSTDPRRRIENTMAEPIPVTDDARFKNKTTELDGQGQASTELRNFSSTSSFEWDSGPEIIFKRRTRKTTRTQNKPNSPRSVCQQYNLDIQQLNEWRFGRHGDLQEEPCYSLHNNSNYGQAHDHVAVSNEGERMSAVTVPVVHDDRIGDQPGETVSIPSFKSECFDIQDTENVQVHYAEAVEANEAEVIEIKVAKDIEIRKNKCNEANETEEPDRSGTFSIENSNIAEAVQSAETIKPKNMSQLVRNFNGNSLQQVEQEANRSTNEQARLLNILNIDRYEPKQRRPQADTDKLGETHEVIFNHDPNTEKYKVTPEDTDRLDLRIKYLDSRAAETTEEMSNSSESLEGFQFNIENRVRWEQNEVFEHSEHSTNAAEQGHNEDLTFDETGVATPEYISFQEAPNCSHTRNRIPMQSTKLRSCGHVNQNKLKPNTTGKLRTTPAQTRIQDRQSHVAEPSCSRSANNHVSNEIHEVSQNSQVRQDSATSTTSSTRRKLIIRGLRNFKESRGAGCPPTWVKEFPCRSKFHPDHYIYDFDEGPLAPKRNIHAMQQCPKRGGRCTKCGVCTIDLCPKCSNCEDDCACPCRQRQPAQPKPNIFKEYGVTNPMETLGGVLSQANSLFHGHSETRGLPYPFNTGSGRISGAPQPPNYFPPPPPPPPPYGGTSYYPCPYPQPYMYGPPPPCFYPPPPPGYFQGQPATTAPPPMMPPYGYAPGMYVPPPPWQDPYLQSQPQLPSYSSNVTFNNQNDMPKFNE